MSTNKTTVVNLKDIDAKEIFIEGSKYKYIGRDFEYAIQGLKASKYENPYSIKKYGSKVPALYIAHLESNLELLTSIKKDLREFVLVCHCKPQLCHGDLLALIADSELTPLEAIAKIKIKFNS